MKPIIYHLALYRKSVPTPHLNQGKHTVVERAKRRGRCARRRTEASLSREIREGFLEEVVLELQSEMTGVIQAKKVRMMLWP